MKALLSLVFICFSFSAFASNFAAAKKNINCQYTQNEKVMVQLNRDAYGNFSRAIFKSASMLKPEVSDILGQYVTSYEIVLDGYMPEGWPRGTSFRINLNKSSPFHDILIDNPNGSFSRLSMTCNGQW